MVIPEESIGHVIGKCRENFNTIETTTGVSLKVRNNEFYIKAESEKTEKLAVRKIKELAVGIFGVKNSAKLRNSCENVRNDMGKLVRGLYYTRTVRINDSFFLDLVYTIHSFRKPYHVSDKDLSYWKPRLIW